MINVNELRISNWVDGGVNGSLYYRVKASDFVNTDFTKTKPIELTEDILIKCGFVEVINNFEWDLPDHSFPVKRKRGTNHFKALYQGVEIKYLHQLQNLYFALKGEELNIEPNAPVSDTTKA
jgi:hypothetical protein